MKTETFNLPDTLTKHMNDQDLEVLFEWLAIIMGSIDHSERDIQTIMVLGAGEGSGLTVEIYYEEKL